MNWFRKYVEKIAENYLVGRCETINKNIMSFESAHELWRKEFDRRNEQHSTQVEVLPCWLQQALGGAFQGMNLDYLKLADEAAAALKSPSTYQALCYVVQRLEQAVRELVVIRDEYRSLRADSIEEAERLTSERDELRARVRELHAKLELQGDLTAGFCKERDEARAEIQKLRKKLDGMTGHDGPLADEDSV